MEWRSPRVAGREGARRLCDLPKVGGRGEGTPAPAATEREGSTEPPLGEVREEEGVMALAPALLPLLHRRTRNLEAEVKEAGAKGAAKVAGGASPHPSHRYKDLHGPPPPSDAPQPLLPLDLKHRAPLSPLPTQQHHQVTLLPDQGFPEALSPGKQE